MFRMLRQCVAVLVLLTIVTAILYPLVVTGVAQATLSRKANGSLIVQDGKVAGSELIGQAFDDLKYFWSRPSATTDDGGKPLPYNAGNSGGSNLGPLNPDLQAAVKKRVESLRAADPLHRPGVPVDLVTSSASGLDPDISVAAAEYQIPRVAQKRRLTESQVRDLVVANTRPRQLGLLGEPRVNVLTLNLALDRLTR